MRAWGHCAFKNAVTLVGCGHTSRARVTSVIHAHGTRPAFLSAVTASITGWSARRAPIAVLAIAPA
jgi:hypothetical protein